MTRFARVVIPGYAHHVLQRGNRKENVFLDDSDRLVYLRLLRDACELYRVLIWAYTLMDNHVHDIAVPENEQSLGRMIKEHTASTHDTSTQNTAWSVTRGKAGSNRLLWSPIIVTTRSDTLS